MFFSSVFWLAAVERAVKTAAQTAVALLTASTTGLLGVDWLQLLSIVGLAALVSVLTSVGSGAVTGSPSLGGEELVPQVRFAGDVDEVDDEPVTVEVESADV